MVVGSWGRGVVGSWAGRHSLPTTPLCLSHTARAFVSARSKAMYYLTSFLGWRETAHAGHTLYHLPGSTADKCAQGTLHHTLHLAISLLRVGKHTIRRHIPAAGGGGKDPGATHAIRASITRRSRLRAAARASKSNVRRRCSARERARALARRSSVVPGWYCMPRA